MTLPSRFLQGLWLVRGSTHWQDFVFVVWLSCPPLLPSIAKEHCGLQGTGAAQAEHEAARLVSNEPDGSMEGPADRLAAEGDWDISELMDFFGE